MVMQAQVLPQLFQFVLSLFLCSRLEQPSQRNSPRRFPLPDHFLTLIVMSSRYSLSAAVTFMAYKRLKPRKIRRQSLMKSFRDRLLSFCRPFVLKDTLKLSSCQTKLDSFHLSCCGGIYFAVPFNFLAATKRRKVVFLQ